MLDVCYVVLVLVVVGLVVRLVIDVLVVCRKFL